MVWFSGLRGAVAFALAVSFLEEPNFNKNIKESIFGTTIIVILFTVMVLGTLTPYMLQWLHIMSPEKHDESKGDHSAVSSDPAGHSISEPEKDIDQTVTENDLTQPIFGWLFRFDAKFVYAKNLQLTDFLDIFALTFLFKHNKPSRSWKQFDDMIQREKIQSHMVDQVYLEAIHN